MTEVKRYTVDLALAEDGPFAHHYIDEGGPWVRYSDYATLAERVRELEEFHKSDTAIRIAQNNEITRLRRVLERIQNTERLDVSEICRKALKGE